MAKAPVAKAAVSGLPPGWKKFSDEIVLYHGCPQGAADDIRNGGIDLTMSRVKLDFGPGFYTTTHLAQAEGWARKKHSWLDPIPRGKQRPAVIEYHVPLGELAKLQSLMFVRGDPDHDPFWSLVSYCRGGATGHRNPNRAAPKDWYDVVCGPVASKFPPTDRELHPDFDQFSFHTQTAVDILNAALFGVDLL